MLRQRLSRETTKAFGLDTDAPVPNFSFTGSTGRRLNGSDQRRYMQTYGGEDAIDWVMDCVDLYATQGSSASYYFTKPIDQSEIEGSSKPVPADSVPQDLVNLFERPNPYMDYTELLELSFIDMLVAGEFFWLKYKRGNDPASPQYGKPLALYRLSPALVEIVTDENDKPKYVEWRAPGKSGAPVRFSPEDIVHVKRPNPHNQWRGLSIIAGSPMAYDIELAVTEAMKNYYDNGTFASGVLESDRTVPPSTWRKIKRQFRQLWQGKQAAGEVVMLERGLKYTPVAANGKDAAYKDISELSMKRIAKAFKVPLPLLGEVGSSDRQAVRESQRIFDNKVLRPFLDRVQTQVNLQLTEAWGLHWYMDYQYVLPLEDKLDLADKFGGLPGVMVKEVRGMVDLEPLEKLGVKDGKKIDEEVLNMPVEGDGHGGPGNANRQPAGDPGRPPNGENVPTFPKGAPNPPNAQTRKSVEATIDRLSSLSDGT